MIKSKSNKRFEKPTTMLSFKDMTQSNRGTSTWQVISNTSNTCIGSIKWCERWNKYAYWSLKSKAVILDDECFDELTSKLKELNTK